MTVIDTCGSSLWPYNDCPDPDAMPQNLGWWIVSYTEAKITSHTWFAHCKSSQLGQDQRRSAQPTSSFPHWKCFHLGLIDSTQLIELHWFAQQNCLQLGYKSTHVVPMHVCWCNRTANKLPEEHCGAYACWHKWAAWSPWQFGLPTGAIPSFSDLPRDASIKRKVEPECLHPSWLLKQITTYLLSYSWQLSSNKFNVISS